VREWSWAISDIYYDEEVSEGSISFCNSESMLE